MLSEAKHLAVGMRIWCSQLKILEAKTIKSTLKSFSAYVRSLASLGMTAKRARSEEFVLFGRRIRSSGKFFEGLYQVTRQRPDTVKNARCQRFGCHIAGSEHFEALAEISEAWLCRRFWLF